MGPVEAMPVLPPVLLLPECARMCISQASAMPSFRSTLSFPLSLISSPICLPPEEQQDSDFASTLAHPLTCDAACAGYDWSRLNTETQARVVGPCSTPRTADYLHPMPLQTSLGCPLALKLRKCFVFNCMYSHSLRVRSGISLTAPIRPSLSPLQPSAAPFAPCTLLDVRITVTSLYQDLCAM